jgi:3-hydroxymyristoyl/3-hydroxydecanoyl-(acyl carrier protein) dehydratase
VSFRSGEGAAAAIADGAARAQGPVTSDRSAVDPDALIRRKVEAFLGVPIPDGDDPAADGELRFLSLSDIEDLILERAPFFFVDRAVAIGNQTVLGVVRMSAERCAGHFPGKPIVPLIELCKAMAQAGIVLVSLHARPHESPIAIGSGESKALAKDFIVAPADVLVKVRLQISRLGLYFVEGSAFVDGQKIGTLAKIVYTLVAKEQLTI